MISDAYVHVSCDREGCGYTDEYQLCAIACNGYDLRNLDGELEQDGWVVDGEDHTCPECAGDDDEELDDEEEDEDDTEDED